MCASNMCVRDPASAARFERRQIVSRLTGARRKISSPRHRKRIQIAPQPPPPEAHQCHERPPASPDLESSAAHCMLTGTSRMVGAWLMESAAKPCDRNVIVDPLLAMAWPMPRIDRPRLSGEPLDGARANIATPENPYVVLPFPHRFDLCELAHKRRSASCGYDLGGGDQTLSRNPDGRFWCIVHVRGSLVRRRCASWNGALRSLGQGHACGALVKDALIRHLYCSGLPPRVLAHLLELLFPSIAAGGPRVMAWVVGSSGDAGPREIL